jgi:hypothetical protein
MKTTWTTDDFDELSWHDCHVHGFRLVNIRPEEDSADLELDIDFILEWEGHYDYRIAPATLTFHRVFGLRFELDYVSPTAALCAFALDGIKREEVNYAPGYRSFRWRHPINWPKGEVTFESPGFTQKLRGESILSGGFPLRPPAEAE